MEHFPCGDDHLRDPADMYGNLYPILVVLDAYAIHRGQTKSIEPFLPLAEAIIDNEMEPAARTGRGPPYEEPEEEITSSRGISAAGIGRRSPYGGPEEGKNVNRQIFA